MAAGYAAPAAAETTAIAETTPIISSAPVLGFCSVEEPPLLPAEPEPEPPPTVTLFAEGAQAETAVNALEELLQRDVF